MLIRVNAMLSSETMKELDRYKKPGISRSFLVRQAIEKYIESRKKEKV